jgi:hypothetical protein
MKKIFIGTDSGATTSKTCGVHEDGTPVTLNLAQSSTNASLGTKAVVTGWIEGVEKFLADNKLAWDQVAGVGLAIPGPYISYGVLDRTAKPARRALRDGILYRIIQPPSRPARVAKSRSWRAMMATMAASPRQRGCAVTKKRE